MRIFVTGASGWIGSALVPELLAVGHQVVGLARSDASAAALTAAGTDVVRGTVDDLDVLASAAAASDGVVHLAFNHDIAFTGDFEGAAEADRRAVDALGAALAGTGRPLVIASGALGLTPGRVGTERDMPADDGSPVSTRQATARAAIALAARDVRSCVLRLPPTCHGEGDNGFMTALVAVARSTGVSGYVGDGANRWPASHRLDAARLFRLAVEHAPAGSVLHGVAEEGVPMRDVAEVIGRHLDMPVASVAPDAAAAHFGWLGGLVGLDGPASSTLTRELLDWRPMHPGLLEDLDKGHYFSQ
ncbi:SDR family oxidoreductase [Yinghuangia seranimata]|uniref:SDR family oxidoreductase n=1 Tax=Yinghuangia seranimata TaxID=408067 RepID=UPI00248C82F1|nr:SDR family oxidoreductase [Yinghuangia seranimata]MDI2128420.1 SDR family oxidoreductase [Yinghuangia seranimata]